MPSRYQLDDIERMIADAIAACEAGHNVYIEGRTVRETVRGNGRGNLEDTAAVFALVIDSDADKQMGWKPNGSASPNMEVETSPGNSQYWIFLRDAAAADIGQQLGERIRKATGTDHDTGNVVQPYRVAGTANYPNKKKIARGRITVPTHLTNVNAEALWTPELIEEAFPLPPRKPKGGDPAGGEQHDEDDIPTDTLKVIRGGVADGHDRSLAFWNVVKVLKSLGFNAEGIVNLLERHPHGIAVKYEGRLQQEVERIYNKLHESESEQILAELNRDNAVVLDGGKTMVLRFEEMLHKADGERYTYRLPTFLKFEDFRNFYLNRYIHVGDERVSIGKWWLPHPERRQYQGLVFIPGGEPVIDERLNLWRGWGVEPKRGDWPLLRERIHNVLAANDDEVDPYIHRWLAWTVQHPAERAEVALVFLGGLGTGKGTLGKAMCRIFGQHARHLSSPEHLTGRFNAHLRQCCFLFADECYGPKDKSAEGQLKRLITERTFQIEPKGREKVEVQNCLHVMLASNHEWVVPAGEYERRYAVFEVAETHRQDANWFEPIYQEMRSGGLEAMLYDLLHYDLGDWHPRQIVRTAALAAQQAESLSPFDAWWEDLLHDGYLPAGNADGAVITGEYQVGKFEGYNFDGSKKYRVEKRKGLYEQARTSSPGLKKHTDAAFGRYLVKRGCTSERVCRQRGWQLPPLAQCRTEWLTRFPKTTWDKPDVTAWQGERDDD